MARSIPKPNPFLDSLLVGLLVCELGVITHTLWDDKQMLCILVAMIVVVALTVKLTKTSFAIGGGWFSRTFLQHLGDPLKKAVTMKKWCDQSWQLAIHVSMTIFELYVLRDETWWQDTTTLWNQGTDTGVFPTQKFSTKLLYITQLAIWIFTAFSCKFLEEIRKDYLVMMTHHVVTIALVTWSYAVGFLPVGVIVLLLHDMTDIPLDMLKMANYLKMEGVPGLFASEILFVVTIVLWFYYRIYQYPIKLLYATIVENREASMTMADAHDFTQLFPHPGPPSWLLFNVLLTTLYCLHIWWGMLLVRALGEAPPASVESLITEDSIVKALHDILPSMNADTATLLVVMQKLADRVGMEFVDLKAKWRPRIKELLPDMLGLLAGGNVSESESKKNDTDVHEEEEEEEEEVVDLRPCRKRTSRIRNTDVDSSDKEGHRSRIVDDSESSEDAAATFEVGDEEDDSDDDGNVAPVKERRKVVPYCRRILLVLNTILCYVPLLPDNSHKKKRKSKGVMPPLKKSKTTTQPESAGLTSLKELGRAAGILNPQLYKLLNRATSTADAEEILRDRLHDTGISFAGAYPSSREISAAKRKREKEKELEGIDTSLIISSGRSRRAASRRNSYKEKRLSGEEDNAKEDEEEADDDDKDDAGVEGSAVSDSDSSEASF
ncbi:hypothetical protein DD238_000833 [Peronospora effusa]|uniref:TLC domain-containing protein n=1 Tax=Peronospora effusa TaxID=542832 RepID=A0A3M6V8K0_9STRA|nr:hypothetical protein DD238_000833 [Peronospora effusa]RQM18223.1 hypothetical protein DD237_000056 [Peronospora effusa]